VFHVFVCPPPRKPALPGVVLDYLADLPPARQTESASAGVTEALGKAYPCGR